MSTLFYHHNVQHTLGPAYNEQSDAHKSAHISRVLTVTELYRVSSNRNGQKNWKIGIRAPKK